MAGTITVGTIDDGSTSIPTNTVINGSAKAWVNFNGTGTVSINAAFNVGNITDNGTGNYTLNFTSSLSDTNYAVVGMCNRSASNSSDSVGIVGEPVTTYSTSQVQIQVNNTSTALDRTTISIAVFR